MDYKDHLAAELPAVYNNHCYFINSTCTYSFIFYNCRTKQLTIYTQKNLTAEEKKKMLSVTRSILLFADRALKCCLIKSHFLTSKSQKCIRCTWKRHHSGDHFIKHEKNWIWLRSGCKNLHLNTVHPYEILPISKIPQTITSYTKLSFLIFCHFSLQFFKHRVIIMHWVCAHTHTVSDACLTFVQAHCFTHILTHALYPIHITYCSFWDYTQI